MARVRIEYLDDDAPGPILVRNDTVHGFYGPAPLLTPAGDRVGQVELVVTWHAATAFEFTFALTTGSYRPPQLWTIARDLLLSGQGDGDVRVDQVGDEVRVRISSPDGWAMFALDHQWLERLLDVTLDLVPANEEFKALDWPWAS